MDADSRPSNTVNLRLTHPWLFKFLSAYAVTLMLQAANFWTSQPTFDPWPGKNTVGAIFLVVGVWLGIFLWLAPNLPMVRLGTLVTALAAAGWGFSNLPQSLAGKASFQLPIWLGLIATGAYFLLREAPVNPTTRKKE